MLWVKTIRCKIILAFLTMSLVTGLLGFLADRDLKREGTLVDRTFDQSLMSINYARAAAADFSAIEAAFARLAAAKDVKTRISLEASIAQLQQAMGDDLSIAVDRAQSDRARAAAGSVKAALDNWNDVRRIGTWSAKGYDWTALDHHALTVSQQLDLLVNYVAGDGFIYRQKAHQTIVDDVRFNLTITTVALMLLAFVAWLLSRRIVVPIENASDVAKKIASGHLDVVVPVGEADELGALLGSMETMRQSIKKSLDREIAMRHSAQMRLIDAMDSSCEGVVLIDPRARIAMANAQASTLLGGAAGPLQVGDPAAHLIACLESLPVSVAQTDQDTTREVELPDGRWLRISQNPTQDSGVIIVYSDITLIKQQQARLKATNLWLDAALANLTQGLCLFDAKDHLRVFNRRFCDIFDVDPQQVQQGLRLLEVIDLCNAIPADQDESQSVFSILRSHIRRKTASNGTLALSGARIVKFWYQPLEDRSWLATFEDVTEHLKAEQKIAFMARHDALTGLPNRVLFSERVETAIAGVGRGDGFALLCLDLDQFKQVNDTLGHPVGDELLRIVGDRLGACIRETDIVARLGGDEFAIIQSGVATAADVEILAKRIIEVIGEPMVVEGHRVAIGVSIGVSLSPQDGSSYGKLLKNADVALYKAKAEGRNQWRFFEADMDERLQTRRLLELDLREALEKNELELHYQPLFDVALSNVCGFEALVRWRHPERGLVAPGVFIPIAEEVGLIKPIGDWVLERACRDCMSWPKQIPVSVNVSPAQLSDRRFAHRVIEVLYMTGLPASRLDLEITESVLLTSTAATLTSLNHLRDMGAKISMDDFGTGYSSLSYLRSFPFDKVKIDQSFTRDYSKGSGQILRAIIGLCRTLGMRVTVEGVERQDQLDFLRKESCDEVQGFLLGKPMEARHVADFLMSQDQMRISIEGLTTDVA